MERFGEHSEHESHSVARLPVFRHERLDQDKAEIRLVRVLPSDEHSATRCEIVRSTLGDGIVYEALSYVWGPPEPSMDILVDGKRMPIRQNLYDYLRSRQSDQTVIDRDLLFIDQICIDQSNIEERNHQVHHMANVYRSAVRVLIWIRGDASREIVLQTLKKIESVLKHGSARAAHRLQINIKNGGVRLLLDGAEEAALKEMAYDEYWNRLWIVQEVFLAKQVHLAWGQGHHRVELSSPFMNMIIKMAGKSPMIDLFERRQEYQASRALEWPAASEVAWQRRCSDPRDAVYAMLGLLRESHILPDYGKSPREVFDDLIRTDLTRTSTYQGYLSASARYRRALGLPQEIDGILCDIYTYEEFQRNREIVKGQGSGPWRFQPLQDELRRRRG